MPFLFLSPSTPDFNAYATTGNEEYWTNRIADAMEPLLRASGVNATRNDPALNAAASIRASNAGEYDFHLAIHSNAGPAALAGQLQGSDAYYYPDSLEGLRMANLIVDNLSAVYLYPEKVRALPTTSIGEVSRVRAPSVLVEVAYHDNLEDAVWITGNVDAIARALALSVTEYFGLPFLTPLPVQAGRIADPAGAALRRAPSPAARTYLTIPAEAGIEIYAGYDSWYTAGYRGVVGFVDAGAVEFL